MSKEPTKTTTPSPRFASTLGSAEWRRCFSAFTLLFLSVWLLNRYIFPVYVSVFAFAREIATATSGVTMLVLALVALKKPSVFRSGPIAVVTLTCLGVGVLMVIAALQTSLPWLLVVGTVSLSCGRACVELMTVIVLVDFEGKECAICVAGASAVAYAFKAAFFALPDICGTVAFIACPVLMFLLAWPCADRLFTRVRKVPSALDLSITQPRSFLPFSHVLFISVFVFRAAYGFSLAFNMENGMPPLTLFAFLPIAVVALQAVFSKRVRPADILYQVASLLIAAGLLAVPLPQFVGTTVPNMLTAAGADCFWVLMYYTLACIGRRNIAQAIPAFGWALFAGSFGTLMGTSFGYALNTLGGIDPTHVDLAIAVVVLLFFAYNVIVLRAFSFEATVQGVEPIREVQAAPVEPGVEVDPIGRQCARVSAAFGLTEREADVMALLAHSRNVPFITDELVISRNTIKTHIKHIYQKLDVHSQQELIDMVETY